MECRPDRHRPPWEGIVRTLVARLGVPSRHRLCALRRAGHTVTDALWITYHDFVRENLIWTPCFKVVSAKSITPVNPQIPQYKQGTGHTVPAVPCRTPRTQNSYERLRVSHYPTTTARGSLCPTTTVGQPRVPTVR